MLKGEDIGIDLGTASVLIYVRGKGIVLREPSVIAVVHCRKGVKAGRVEACRLLGRDPGNIVAVRALKEGVFAEYALTERMRLLFVQKVLSSVSGIFKTRVMVGVSSGVTDVERRAVVQAVSALAHKV
jgi:Actin-like ATPase involved in cell morphogenesis